MKETRNEFRKQYAKCREQSGLSYRGLQAATGIKHSALVAMQTGSRPCGEQSARRLATAFGLSDSALDTFVLTALNTSKERVFEKVQEYPSEVLNLLGLLLMKRGIKPGQIVGCGYNPAAPDCLMLTLRKGRTLHLHVQASESL